MFKLVLAHHTLDEWCEVMAGRLRELECSEGYVELYLARLVLRDAL